MALQERNHNKNRLTKKRMDPHAEIDKPQRPLPMWCRGIMSGCVNCGGCA